MSHTAHFRKLVGKTIVDIEHKDPEGGLHEMIAIRFNDDTVLVVRSLVAYALDATITEPELPPR